MKIGFVADVHLGNHRLFGGPVTVGRNARFDETRRCFEDALLAARSHGCDAFVVCGDLFDTVAPTPQQLAPVFSALANAHMEVLLLVGNHEQVSMDSGDNALVAFGILRNVLVLDRVTSCYVTSSTAASHQQQRVPIHVVPFVSAPALERTGGDLAHYIRSHVRELPAGYHSDFLLLHAGIVDEATPSYLRSAHDAIHCDDLFTLMDDIGAKVAIAGNWHTHRVWYRGGKRIIQCGALVPTGFDNPGLAGYGKLVIVDSETFAYDTVDIRSPRFLTAHADDITPQELDTMIASLPETTQGAVSRAYVQLRVSAQDLPKTAGFDPALVRVVVDKNDVVRSTSQAARAATSAVTLAAAVREYVSNMSLPTHAQRDTVLALVRAALKIA